jgi:hypothetical protein
LAIVVPFTIESNKLLQEDKQDTTAQLLVEVVRLLNDTSARGHAELPERFIADHRDVLVNQLWYLSTVLNLVAVLIGTFCLQWISAFERGDDSRRNSSSAADMLKARCIRSAGFIGWGVNHTPELLLLIVQLSIALFTSGLVYFLWSINNAAAKPALAIAGITGIMLCLANVIPFLQPLLAVLRPSMLARHCPYKSPTSWFVRLVCDSLVLTFLSFKKSRDIGCNCIGVGERFRFWLGLLPAPWRDYQWKAYNESYVRCLQMFDQAPERFMGLGLPAVLDILISKRDIVDITCRFIQGIRQITDRDKTLCVFGVNEHDVLKSIEQRTHKDGPEFEKFMDNFTDLLIVNLLAAKSPKVHRSLVLHCVEMYTQLKESIFSIFDDLDVPAVFTIFDRCKVTPLVSQWDVNGWGIGETAFIFVCGYSDLEVPIEIKFKFLKYMNCALDAKLPIPTYDFDTAIYIIEVDEERCLHYNQSSGNPLLMAPIDWNHLVRVAIISMWRIERGTVARFLSKSYADW